MHLLVVLQRIRPSKIGCFATDPPTKKRMDENNSPVLIRKVVFELYFFCHVEFKLRHQLKSFQPYSTLWRCVRLLWFQFIWETYSLHSLPLEMVKKWHGAVAVTCKQAFKKRSMICSKSMSPMQKWWKHIMQVINHHFRPKTYACLYQSEGK